VPVALPHTLTAAMGLGKASACCVRSGSIIRADASTGARRGLILRQHRRSGPPSVAPQAQRPSKTQLRVVSYQQEAAE
jgi:hypothetical protein